MAAAANFNRLPDEQLCSMTECSICVEPYTDPKSLPCLHTFCLKCIKQYGGSKKPGDQMDCPLCRNKFAIPPGGFAKLPNNFLIHQLMEMTKSDSFVNQQQSRNSSGIGAYLTPQGDGNDRKLRKKSNGCSDFEKYRLKLDSCTKTTKTELEQLEADRAHLIQQTADSEQRVFQKTNDLKQLLVVQQEMLLTQIRDVREKQLKEMATRKTELDMHLANLEAFKKQSDSPSSRHQRSAEGWTEDNLESKMNQLVMMQISLNNEKLSTVEVHFSASNMADVAGRLTSLIGNLKINEIKGNFQRKPEFQQSVVDQQNLNSPIDTRQVGQSTASQSPQTINRTQQNANNIDRIQAKMLRRCELGTKSSGIAQLGKRIYVLCYNSKIIRVYDSRTFTRSTDITIGPPDSWFSWFVEKFIVLGDIAACHIYDCLYVSDVVSTCIWQLTNEGRLVNKWLQTAYISDAYCRMSVTDGRVVLLGSKPARIDVYGPNARLELTIPLPSAMKECYQAIQLKSGNFVVSHGSSNQGLHRICEFSKDGSLIRSFGCTVGAGHGQLNCPQRMFVDDKGNIYVADTCNDRVLVIDSTLSHSKVLLAVDKHNTKFLASNALCLCYDADTKLIIVAPKNECFEIFEII